MTQAARSHGWPLEQPVTIDHAGDSEPNPIGRLDDGPRDNEVPSDRHRLAEALHPPTSRRRQPAVLDRERILEATARCLDDSGYDGTTIRSIAKRLDCAVGSIYRYFADKRELLTAVCEARFQASLDAAKAGDLDASARRYLEAANDRPETYRLMFWLAALKPGTRGGALPDVVESLAAAWAEALDETEAARSMWVALHGRAMWGETHSETDEAIDGAPARRASSKKRSAAEASNKALDRQTRPAELESVAGENAGESDSVIPGAVVTDIAGSRERDAQAHIDDLTLL